MTDDLVGPSLGELRAASANLMVAHLAAGMYAPLRAAADRETYLVTAQTLGRGREAAEQIVNEMIEDRLHQGLPLDPVYKLALEKIYAEDAYVSPERAYLNALPADRRRALEECADEAALLQGCSRDAVLYALVHVMADYCDGKVIDDV